MHLILRSMLRRRFRTMLTAFGVSVGIFGFVIMGALAEKMNLHARTAIEYYRAYVWVLSKGTFAGVGGSIPMSVQAKIESIDGVVYASPRVLGPMDYSDLGSPFSACGVLGVELAPDRNQLRMFRLQSGAFLPEGSSGLVLLGDLAARKYKKHVGDVFEIHGRSFTVHGILQHTNADPDHMAFMDISDARQLLYVTEDRCSSLAVLPAPGADADAIAAQIERRCEEVHTLPPSKLGEYVASMMSFMNNLVFGATVVAVLAGSLGVVNTMVMAATERAREIATKKAIGASTRHLFGEFVAEAAVIGLAGGIVGVLLGLGIARGLNAHLGAQGMELFAVTTRLVLWALVVAVVVGCAAGVYPALRAARTDPVRVLRST